MLTNRRQFLELTTLAGTGLVTGATFASKAVAQTASDTPPNAFAAPGGSVTAP